MFFRAFVAAASFAIFGCGASRSPRATAEAYDEALRARDGATVYALLDDEARASIDREAVLRLVEQSRGDLVADRSGPVVSARIEGALTEFVLEEGRFRVASFGDLLPWDQSTPDAAVETLLRAWDRSRYDILLRLVPAEQRSALDEAALRAYFDGPERSRLDVLFSELREPTRGRAETHGDRALVHFGEAPTKILRFVREGRLWKVVELVP